MTERNKYLTLITGILAIVLNLTFIILLFYTPFLIKEYTISGSEYIYKVFFFGFWKHFQNGELWAQGGAIDLNYFLMISPIFIIIGFVGVFIFTSWFGFTWKQNLINVQKTNRLIGVSLIISGIIGLIGTLLFIPYTINFQTLNPDAVLTAGFYLAIGFFSLAVILGIPLLVLSKPIEVQRPSYH